MGYDVLNASRKIILDATHDARVGELIPPAQGLGAAATEPESIAARTFAVEPTVQQRLLDRIQQDDEGVMGRLNNILVNEIKGLALDLQLKKKLV